MIELRLLGGVGIRAATALDPDLLLAREKSFALLAYLAAASPFGSHRRDSLVALLWPELDQEHARTALRKAVHGLRNAAGSDVIVSRGETIGLAESGLWCDVRAFKEAVDANRVTDALSLYRGDFLPGSFLPDAPGFERWVERKRQELRETAARAARTASDASVGDGNIRAGIDWARRALDLAPDDEGAARKLIALLNRSGDRAGAIRVYEQFERYLANELEVAPSSETSSLMARIRRDAAPDALLRGSAPRIAVDESLEPVGLQTRPANWRVRAAWAVALGVVVALVSAVAATRNSARPTATATLDNAHVAVMPLDNQTGRPELDFVGLEVQDWLSRGLQETGLVRVYTAEKRIADPSDPATADGERKWAAALGAAMLVRGRYYLRADSILMEVSIIDVAEGGALATMAPVLGAVKDPTPAIEALRRRTIAVLATYVDPALKQWARAASQPPSFEAYQEFSAGQRAKNRNDFDAAITHFIRAGMLDSGYVYPILIAAQLEMQVRSADSASALLRSVRARNLHLAPFDEALADALEAQLASDFQRAFDADQRLRHYVMPGSDWELAAASMAIALNRPRVAMEIVRSVDLHRPGVLDSWDVFVPITNAYHLSGQNEAMLALLKKEAVRWQNAAFIVVVEMQALAALSRPAEADSLWRTLLHNTARERKGIVMWAAWEGARELRAHGSRDAARTLALEALDSLPTVPASSPWGSPVRWQMQVLREAGRPREALVLAQTIAAKNPNEANMAAIIADLRVRLGDTASARRIEARLAQWPPGSDARDVLVARARVAAALGDKARAVSLLHAACDNGCWSFEDLHIVLEFDSLRSYPPFQQLLRPKPGFEFIEVAK